MLFTNDAVLMDESRVGVNAKLLRLWQALDSKGFKRSRYKCRIRKLQLQWRCENICNFCENLDLM